MLNSKVPDAAGSQDAASNYDTAFKMRAVDRSLLAVVIGIGAAASIWCATCPLASHPSSRRCRRWARAT